MEPSLFLSMLGFLWVAAITPGPNNLLLTTSGANFGFMRSLWLMIGIMLGMQSILLLVAFGVGSLILVYPSLHLILKILGSLYLLWLAWKVATAAYEKLETDVAPPQPVRLYQGWLLQFLNPKAWLMALGAVASFSLAGDKYNGSIAAIALGILAVNIVAGIIWLAFGTVIGRCCAAKSLDYLQRFHGAADCSLCITDLALRSGTMAENYYHVVAFTGEGLRGNPAGVCLLTQPLPTARLQAIANEIGLPETSFVWDEGDMTAIRWFTPEREVDLCGHGTLAAAHVMFSAVNPALKDIRFRSAGGELFVKRDERDGERLVLDFPARPPQKVAEPAGLAALLGVQPQEVWQAKALLAVVENEAQVRALRPDIPALIALAGRAVIVTAPGDTVDFVSRYFTLDGGEDPVTGSAHCTLMPYWTARLGRHRLHARQISARGGELFCELQGDRTLLGGYAHVFLHGTIAL